MKKSCSFVSLALGAAALGVAMTPAAAATCCGGVGPYQIISITNVGNVLSASFQAGSGQAYDSGNDDVYYKVVNNTTNGTVISNITLSGSGIFGFEGDGIGAGPNYSAVCPTNTSCSAPSGIDNSGGGYGGAISFFSLVNTSNGSVFFAGGLAQGASTLFSLEAPAAQITVTGVNTATPIPAALPLFAGGLGLMGLFARRRKQKVVQA
jgi:hypothetical protein